MNIATPAIVTIQVRHNRQLNEIVHHFDNIREAYHWSAQHIGLEVPQDRREGVIGEWEFINYNFLQTILLQHPTSQVEVFFNDIDEDDYISIMISFDPEAPVIIDLLSDSESDNVSIASSVSEQEEIEIRTPSPISIQSYYQE